MNRGPLVLKATDLPTEPQPLPLHQQIFTFSYKINIVKRRKTLPTLQSVKNEQSPASFSVFFKQKLYFFQQIYEENVQVYSYGACMNPRHSDGDSNPITTRLALLSIFSRARCHVFGTQTLCYQFRQIMKNS